MYMGALPNGTYSPSSHHFSMLQSVIEGRYSSISRYSCYSLFFFLGNQFVAIFLNFQEHNSCCSSAENSLILSYKRSFNGFAAYLTDQESLKLASKCAGTFSCMVLEKNLCETLSIT